MRAATYSMNMALVNHWRPVSGGYSVPVIRARRLMMASANS